RRARRRWLEVPVRRLLDRWRADDGRPPLVVVPPAVRSALVEPAEAERPNEACGVVVFRDGEAERYIPGTNLSESPYRYELQVPPETWFLEDECSELAVFHSHVSSPARPSRTELATIRLW